MQQDRGTGKYGERLSKNNRVHDNTIGIAAGLSGPTKSQGKPAVFTQNNTFSGNHYIVADRGVSGGLGKAEPRPGRNGRSPVTTSKVQLHRRISNLIDENRHHHILTRWARANDDVRLVIIH